MAILSDREEDFCFLDFETRALPGVQPPDDSVVTAGVYRYAQASYAIVLTYAIGSGKVQCLTEISSDGEMRIPDELMTFCDRVTRGEAWFVAWNMAFDRAVWNQNIGGYWYPLAPEMTLDAMVQAMAANLPPDLASASLAVGGPGKRKGGKKLIDLFSKANGGTPQSHPEEWRQFLGYAIQDTEALRDVWRKTRPLEREEWEDYWVSEAINERGIAVDLELAAAAKRAALWNIERSNRELTRLTGDEGMTIHRHERLAEWLYLNIEDNEARSMLDAGADDDEEDEDGSSLSLRRRNVQRLIAWYRSKAKRTESEETVLKVLLLREYGGVAAPKKFGKMIDQADDGRLKGSYVLNGAGQTGRFSSRGIQIHNMPRETLGAREEEAIAELTALPECGMEAYARKYEPLGQTLTRLVRPALIAPPGRTLVWCDWSNIEARVNPWLSLTRSGDKKLDVFRNCDAHPEEPDVYCHTAGDMIDRDPWEITKAERQTYGKVPELSLGFGGGVGALIRMATTYGVHVGEVQAQTMVDGWRKANPWARRFWDKLWKAIEEAMETHLTRFEAGRVSYWFQPGYLGGSLMCALPNGRVLTYPQCRWQHVETIDPKTGEPRWQDRIMYRKGHGRVALWYGKACENVTQATAGSLLRAKLCHLEKRCGDWMPVVLHTHDDICVEVDEHRAEEAKAKLEEIMTTPEDWCGGLPLAGSASSNWWFTKNEDQV